jgi:ubiquinone/menaquinone biosynthesis C-methylase UbiE
MKTSELKEELGGIDIYLLDLILKDTYTENSRILDAGSGRGRNSTWLINNGFDVYSMDRDAQRVNDLKNYWTAKGNSKLHVQFPSSDHFLVGELDALPFQDHYFDHIISSAVLHFARDHDHFDAMMAELIRVLKPGGTIFIRMTSDVGIESRINMTETGVVSIPDGSDRYLITRNSLSQLLQKYSLSLVGPFKNVNVEDIRVMSVIVLKK